MPVTNMTSYDQNNLVEDVSDIIFDISPTETPFINSLPKGSCSNRIKDWHEDELDAAAANAKIEGSDAGAANQSSTQGRQNYVQTLEKVVKVSGVSRAVDQYGADDEYDRQATKKMKEIKRDLEFACVGDATQTKVLGNGTDTAGKMDCAQQLIHADTTSENSGIPRAFTETILLEVMKKTYEAGGEANNLLIPVDKAEIVAGFAGASGRSRDIGGSKTVVNAVEIYDSPYGMTTVTMDRFMDSSTVLAYSPENWELLSLRPFFHEELAKTGDSTHGQILGDYTLVHNNFKASGMAKDLS